MVPVMPEQVDELQWISEQTFVETFADKNNADDFAAYLKTAFDIKQIQEELSEPQSFFYFAMQAKQILGYLKLNTGAAQTELKTSNSLEIERIYVLQSAKGQKIGKSLLEKSFQVAALQKADFVWLGVWEKNTDAIGFYQKHGFEVFDKHVFMLGKDAQTDLLMRVFI